MTRSAASVAESIGGAIREAREHRGLTQVYVAAFLNVGRTQLVNIEKGTFMPSIATVEEVADALGVSFVYEAHKGWRLA